MTKIKSLSANTLFHFTSSLDNLFGILLNDFYPRYSLEIYSSILDVSEDKAIPMVSFCDIPLSQIKNHADVYGNYAIGLTKKWGIHNSVSPVIYVYKGSRISREYEIIHREILDNKEINLSLNGLRAAREIFRYLKPYEGELWRNGTLKNPQVRFYDEREWRYVPYFDVTKKNGLFGTLTKEKFLKREYIKKVNKKLESCKLSFVPNDIRYIIVDKNSEVLQMVEKIRSIKGSKYRYNDVQLLITRIISMEQIIEDF